MKHVFLKITLMFLTGLSISATAIAADEKYKENLHYKRVANVPVDKQNGKIKVTEFFLYSCPHCRELEPKLEKWVEKNKEKVTYEQIPVIATPSMIPLAKSYYIAKKLNILDKTHEALYKSIHDDKKVYLNEYELSKFFAKYNVKPDDFLKEFNSEDIVNKVGNARSLSAKYGFRGVPAVVLNNEFKTAPFYVKDQEQMIEIMDFLLEKTINRN